MSVNRCGLPNLALPGHGTCDLNEMLNWSHFGCALVCLDNSWSSHFHNTSTLPGETLSYLKSFKDIWPLGDQIRFLATMCFKTTPLTNQGVWRHLCACVCVPAWGRAWVRACVTARLRACLPTCVPRHQYTYTYTYTHPHAHIDTYTHTHYKYT